MGERVAPAVPATASTWISSGRLSDVLLNLLLAGIYWAIVEFTLFPTRLPDYSILVWLPAGAGVAAVLLAGTRVLPGVALGAFFAHVVGEPVWAAIAVSGAAVLETIVVVHLLRRFAFDAHLERVRDVFILGLLAGPAGALIAALVGAAAALLSNAIPPEDLPLAVAFQWTRNCLGVQVVVAAALGWTQPPPARFTWPRVVASAILLIAILSLVLRPFAEYPPTLTLALHSLVLLGLLSAQLLAAAIAEREDSHARRLALEEQLRHAQKMEAVGRLAGGIAHDFNNLLTAIIGYTEIVMLGFDAKDPRRADAEEIKRAAERAAELTRQMLAFSRRQVLQPKVVDLNLALQKVEPMLRRVIGEDIVMTIAAKATRPLARVDQGQIEQVIMNLVVNARDAMPKGGRLTVETDDATLDASMLPPEARPGRYVRLAVSDSGVGMSPAVRARIFEPYFTTKEVGKGTGLGLSTAYGIVQQSDGFIHVYSEPGLGTTFRIYLPRSDEHLNAADEGQAEAIPGGSEHVLLVEDDASVRRATRETLLRLGYSVTEAASGRAGLALGSDDTRHFDLALCDVILGDMSGPAVYEALRALRPSVRVLYMSGYADEAIVRTGVLEEGYPFLQKPFTPSELAVKIRGVLDGERD